LFGKRSRILQRQYLSNFPFAYSTRMLSTNSIARLRITRNIPSHLPKIAQRSVSISHSGIVIPLLSFIMARSSHIDHGRKKKERLAKMGLPASDNLPGKRRYEYSEKWKNPASPEALVESPSSITMSPKDNTFVIPPTITGRSLCLAAFFKAFRNYKARDSAGRKAGLHDPSLSKALLQSTAARSTKQTRESSSTIKSKPLVFICRAGSSIKSRGLS